MGIAFMFIGAGVFIVMSIFSLLNYKSAVNHMAEIRKMKFKFTNYATSEDIYNKIEPPLRRFYGEKINLSRDENLVVVACNSIKYEIILNGDATFSVRWQKTLLEKLLAFIGEIFDNEMEPNWKYTRVRTDTPRIAYELQQAFGIVSSENETENEVPKINLSKPTKIVNQEKTSGTFGKVMAVVIVIAGLLIMMVSYENPATKTIGQQQNQDEEYFLGTYDDGRKAYLLTDTVEYFTKMHEDGEEKGYTCNVKSVDSSGNAYYDRYELRWYQSELLNKNGEGYGLNRMSQIYKMPDSVEMQLIAYLRERREKENLPSQEFEGTREDKEKFGRLIMCGYWEGERGTNLNISTDQIVEVNSKTYEKGESFRYYIHSINKDSNDTITIKVDFIQGGTSFYAELIFKDLNNMILKKYAAKETLTYRARTEPYPQHLDDSLQYVLLYGHMGSGFYMDLETLQVIDDTNWTVNVVSANMQNGQRRNMHMEFSLNNGIPFISTDNGNWRAVDVEDTTGVNMLGRNAFLTSYYYSFARNFNSRF